MTTPKEIWMFREGTTPNSKGGLNRSKPELPRESQSRGRSELLNEARSWQDRGQYEIAQARLREILAVYPRCRETLRSLAKVCETRKRYGEAASLWLRLASVDPTTTEWWLRAGRAHAKVGDNRDAERAYREVLVREPRHEKALVGLGKVLTKEKRHEEAHRLLADLERSVGDTGDGKILCARVAAAVKQPRDAERLLRDAVAIGRSPEAMTALASHYAGLGYLDRSLYWIRRGLSCSEGAPDLVALEAEVLSCYEALEIPLPDDEVGELDETRLPERAVGSIIDHILARPSAPTYQPIPGRILFVGAHLGSGGTERQLVQLVRHMRESRQGQVDPRVLMLSLDPDRCHDFYLEELAATGVEVRAYDGRAPSDPGASVALAPIARLLSPSMLGGRARADRLKWIAEQIAELRPELLACWYGEGWVAGLAGALVGVPAIVLRHGNIAPDPSQRAHDRQHFAERSRPTCETSQQLMRLPQVTIANNSENGARDYERWLGVEPGTVAVVPNGINQARFINDRTPGAEVRQQLGLSPDALLVGSVMRLVKQKNPFVLLDAFARVAEERPEARFVIVGDGPLRPEVGQHASRLGLDGKLTLAGRQSPVAPWYRAMDVFVLASRFEGLPNVLLEAQTCGTAVVATDVGGVREVVAAGDTGLLVGEPTAQPLTEQILWALDHPEWRAKAAQAGPVHVSQRFSFGTVARRLMRLRSGRQHRPQAQTDDAAGSLRYTTAASPRVGLV